MRVGFDFWNCINQHPSVFREMAEAFQLAGHEVYIISAYGDRQLASNSENGYVDLIRTYGVPHTEIIPVYFGKDDKSIPELKWKEIKRLGITVFFDDRPSTIEFLHQQGVAAFLVPKPIKS